MTDRDRNSFRTGERVNQPGRYTCQAGETRELKAGESFPVCPTFGKDTIWTQGT